MRFSAGMQKVDSERLGKKSIIYILHGEEQL
jgi:hypothetical protein